MRIRTYLFGSVFALGALASMGAYAAESATADINESAAADARWKVWGGAAGIRFSSGLIDDLSIELIARQGKQVQHRDRPALEFQVRDTSALDFDVANGSFAGFTGGSLSLRGGYDLKTAGGLVSLRDLRFVPRKGEPYVLDVIGSDGVVWLYADKMMYEVVGDSVPVLSIRTMDLRIAPALARMLGSEKFIDSPVADVWMRLNIHSDKGDPSVFLDKGAPTGRWPGAPVAGVPGAVYEADVFMHHFFSDYWRREAGTDGPGPGDGYVVFAPSSTLRNNRNNGTRVNTYPTLSPPRGGAFPPAPGPSDPNFETRLHASTALHTAHVAWYSKFTGNSPPYGNDQHPFLIWNLYRVDADGAIEQIARSGVKHAWLTTNSPCDESAPSNHVLARGCADTYSSSNNDEITDLGPRSEIVPAAGLWGRCGSVYDRDCNGSQDSGAPCQGLTGPARDRCLDYDHRMMTLESDIEAANNTGASYLFESWYIVRDDINIYNTMQNRPVTFDWTGSSWDMLDTPNADLLLGPAIDRWVSPTGTDPNQRNTEIVNDGGHAKVAVKVVDLGDGTWRYDYAVMNLDFARAQTSGSEPNLRVLSNDGFTEFSLPVSAAITLTDVTFSDGDQNASNDWQMTQGANSIVWAAPAGNRLNWGTMFRFSLTANAAPVEADVSLTTAQVAPVEVLTATTLLPESEAVETYTVGGVLSGLAAGQSVTLALNGGETVEVDTNGVFGFVDELLDGSAYEVTVDTQPPTQQCSVESLPGTINGADVTDVEVVCIDNEYTIGGSVSGLASGQEITLQLGDGETIVVDNGPFLFATGLVSGSDYAVSIVTAPEDRNCSVNFGTGEIVASNITDVQVACTSVDTYMIGGTVSGLTPMLGIDLQLNGGEIQTRFGNGPFQFNTQLPGGANYDVVIVAQPAGRNCAITGGSDVMPDANVSDIQVTCTVIPTYSIGGSVSGLPGGSGLGLQLNDATPITLTVNGSFNFPTELPDAAEYTVTVTTQPSARVCTIENAAGTIDAADVHDVVVTCVRPPVVMFDDSFE